MITGRAEGAAIDPERGWLLSELFHALNQPITALHCSFELALHAPRSESEYRNCLLTGMDQAARAASLAGGIRELLEAAEPASAAAILCLQPYVREAVEHFLPVANDAGSAITLHCKEGFTVYFDPERLRRILYYLLDLVLPFACNEVLAIQAKENGSHGILEFASRISGGGIQELLPQIFSRTREFSLKEHHWKQRLKWLIAQQLLRTAGGSLLSRSEKKLHLEMRLPLSKEERPE